MKKIRQKQIVTRSALMRFISGLTAIAVCCILVRTAANEQERGSTESGGVLSAAAERLTGLNEHSERPASASIAALMAQSSVLRSYGCADAEELADAPEEAENEREPVRGTLYYDLPESEFDGEEEEKSEESEYVLSEYVKDVSLAAVKNNSGLEIDVPALMSEELNISVSGDGPKVLIIHTHGSEAYTPEGDDGYEVSDTYRTEDTEKSVIALGTILSEELNSRGIPAVHDSGIYDYPSYAGSYNRTCEAIKEYIDRYPSISIVIDLHRDASEVNGSLDYKTTADINGEKCAQVMLVVGTNASGLEHPNWRENLKFALELQCAAESRYPTLTRPISISRNRYNQHLTSGSLILEVGYCGNTLEEARKAVRLFADAAADVILPLEGKQLRSQIDSVETPLGAFF